jgi:hypothetical protein
MIDSFTKEPIRVTEEGGAGPYIMVQLDQLDLVKKLLDDAGYGYQMDEEAISFNDQPFTSVINLGSHADVSAIQRLLDDNQDPSVGRPRRSRSGRRR